jgi:hypothetical protein
MPTGYHPALFASPRVMVARQGNRLSPSRLPIDPACQGGAAPLEQAGRDGRADALAALLPAKSRLPLLPTVETCLGRRGVPSPYLDVRIWRMGWISGY